MSKKNLPRHEHGPQYFRMGVLQSVIDSGDSFMSEFYIEHRKDKPRIDACMERLLREKDRLAMLGRTDMVLNRSIDTLSAHMEFDRIRDVIESETGEDTIGGVSLT